MIVSKKTTCVLSVLIL